MKYQMERKRFNLLCGEQEIEKTAELIAYRSWYSWRHCLKRMRQVPADQRAYAWKLLRAAQAQRAIPWSKEDAWFDAFIQSKIDFLKCFTVKAHPAAYKARAQPVVMNGERIGMTLKAERAKAGMILVYYTSKYNRAVKCIGVKAVLGNKESPVPSEQSVFIVEPLSA